MEARKGVRRGQVNSVFSWPSIRAASVSRFCGKMSIHDCSLHLETTEKILATCTVLAVLCCVLCFVLCFVLVWCCRVWQPLGIHVHVG